MEPDAEEVGFISGSSRRSKDVMRSSSCPGFTLIELLIVVVVLGILAAIAIPQFTSTADEAKASSLQSNLQVLRRILEMYRFQHNAIYPGYPFGGGSPTEEETVNQLTLVTRVDRSWAALGTAGFPYGPYVKRSLPDNSVNGLNTWNVLDHLVRPF